LQTIAHGSQLADFYRTTLFDVVAEMLHAQHDERSFFEGANDTGNKLVEMPDKVISGPLYH